MAVTWVGNIGSDVFSLFFPSFVGFATAGSQVMVEAVFLLVVPTAGGGGWLLSWGSRLLELWQMS